MLDSPEAILKQRISELEKMEQHQKQQVFFTKPDESHRFTITACDALHVWTVVVVIIKMEFTV